MSLMESKLIVNSYENILANVFVSICNVGMNQLVFKSENFHMRCLPFAEFMDIAYFANKTCEFDENSSEFVVN